MKEIVAWCIFEKPYTEHYNSLISHDQFFQIVLFSKQVQNKIWYQVTIS